MPFHDELAPSERALRATAALESIGFGPVDWLLEAGSTNADLLAEAQAGAPHGRILVTDYQSAGKGRRDRTWTTAPGDALLASVLLRPTNLAVDELSTLTSAVAIATTEACQAAGFRGIEIKWPNDLVVSGPSGYRKLAGILAQSTIYQGKAAVVIGLGLNVVGDRLGELRNQAVALSDLGAAPDRTDLLISIIEQLARWLEVVESPGREQLWTRYRELSAILGREVHVDVDGRVIAGIAANFTDKGALLVDATDGQHELTVGDVSHVRAI